VVGLHQLLDPLGWGSAVLLARSVLALVPELVEAGGQALGQAPGVDEDECRAVGLHQLQQARVDGGPDGPAGRRSRGIACGGLALDHLAQLAHVVDRHHDLDVELLAYPGVDDGDGARAAAGPRVIAAAQEAGHHVERPLGGGQADALRRRLALLRQAFEGQGHVGAPLGGDQRVDLVDDDRLDPPERLPGLGGEHEVERLGRGDEDVRRGAQHLAAHVGGRVARAQPHAGLSERLAQALGRGPDARDGRPQVLVDIDGQGAERGDVHDTGALGRPCRPLAPHQAVDAPQESGQGLARACRSQDQRVVALGDGGPALALRRRGCGEARLEPGLHGRREQGGHHAPSPYRGGVTTKPGDNPAGV
jgi:hypothetical protein